MDIVDIFQFIKEHNKYDLWRISMILIGNVPALLWLIDSRLYSMPTDHKQLRSFQIHLLDKHEIRKNYMVNFQNLYTWKLTFFELYKVQTGYECHKTESINFPWTFFLMSVYHLFFIFNYVQEVFDDFLSFIFLLHDMQATSWIWMLRLWYKSNGKIR